MTEKQRRRERRKAKKEGQDARRASERVELIKTYRLLARQPMAIPIGLAEPFSLRLNSRLPLVHLRQVSDDLVQQRIEGGTLLAIEFESTETDLLRAAHEGLELAEDVFSVVSLHRAAPLPPSAPVFLEALAADASPRFAAFSGLRNRVWKHPVDEGDVEVIQGAFAHWGALAAGQRLRRAARRYRGALRRENPLEAFQDAYIGLESLEKPLAEEMNVPGGHEVVTGKCDSCGFEYQRKRTMLSGVREYIKGSPEADPADTARRAAEWKELSDLRNASLHGLAAAEELDGRAEQALPAALHYLHDATCHLLHAHKLENNEYVLARFALSRIVVIGKGRRRTTPLSAWKPAIELGRGTWVDSPQGALPETMITSVGGATSCACFTLPVPLNVATLDDLEPLNTELVQEAGSARVAVDNQSNGPGDSAAIGGERADGK